MVLDRGWPFSVYVTAYANTFVKKPLTRDCLSPGEAYLQVLLAAGEGACQLVDSPLHLHHTNGLPPDDGALSGQLLFLLLNPA